MQIEVVRVLKKEDGFLKMTSAIRKALLILEGQMFGQRMDYSVIISREKEGETEIYLEQLGEDWSYLRITLLPCGDIRVDVNGSREFISGFQVQDLINSVLGHSFSKKDPNMAIRNHIPDPGEDEWFENHPFSPLTDSLTERHKRTIKYREGQ